MWFKFAKKKEKKDPPRHFNNTKANECHRFYLFYHEHDWLDCGIQFDHITANRTWFVITWIGLVWLESVHSCFNCFHWRAVERYRIIYRHTHHAHNLNGVTTATTVAFIGSLNEIRHLQSCYIRPVSCVQQYGQHRYGCVCVCVYVYTCINWRW